MAKNINFCIHPIHFFLSSTAFLASAIPAYAQVETEDATGLQDIIVTAQKREQSLQDVPIAVTAVSADTLKANRITSVMDLASTTPNFSVRETAGGAQIPTFALRGVVTIGGQAGVDRSISQYLDGVYIGAVYGAAFELPDVERIEILRGPQGTLFGRNATGGSVSIITKDPTGEFGLRQQLTYGNYDQLRSSTRVELPQVGPFSASISYTHDERRGDIRNSGAGTVWDRSNADNPRYGIQVSPKWLGSRNSESVFAAVKFEPSDNFRTVYKFDWMENHYTPSGAGTALLSPVAPQFFGSAIITAALASQPRNITGLKRPKEVNNAYTVPSYQKAYGHSLTSYLDISDNLSLKNIFGYRKGFLYATSDLSGLGTFTITPAVAAALASSFDLPPGSMDGNIGNRLEAIASSVESRVKNYSDELQLNYNSNLVTVTAGALYYYAKSTNGSIPGLPNVQFVGIIPASGVLPTAAPQLTSAVSKSYAAYAQAEVHLTPQLDVVGGIRITQDKKNGVGLVPPSAEVPTGQFPFKFNDTRESYLLGVNFKPTEDILVYAKYSTAFVAGGATADIPFDPETVKAWEAGVKADLFDNRLRFNLAAFMAKYKNLQGTGSGMNLVPPRPELGAIIIREADLKTKGFEAEVTALPIRNITLTGGLGYTSNKFSNVNPAGGADRRPTYRPPWTASLSAQYESDPLFGDATLTARVDASWHSKFPSLFRPSQSLPHFDLVWDLPASWIVNSRVALRDVDLGPGKVEIAGWVKNLFDSDKPQFGNDVTFVATATYERARTFGVDLTFDF